MTTDDERVQRGGWREIRSCRLSCIEKFISEIKNLVLDTFVNFKPVERFKNGSDMSEFRSLYDDLVRESEVFKYKA